MIAVAYWSLLMFLPALFPAIENAEEYNYQSYYDIIKNDKVIGFMKCSKRQNLESVEYINESSARFSILVDISVYSKLQSSYSNGILQDGKLIRMVNGKTKSDKKIAWNEDGYLINNDGKSSSLKSKISFSTACLMYTEPLGMKYIFSENFGKFVALDELALHKYALKLPGGDDNIYTYRDGKCVEVEVRTTLATVYIRYRK